MRYVRALASGLWRHAPFSPKREWERTLVMALEEGTWGVNRHPVNVFPGLVVGFDEPDDAEFFLRLQRGDIPAPNPGTFVIFDNDNDAQFFVTQRLAEFVTREEVEEAMRRMQEDGDDGVGQREPETEITPPKVKTPKTKKSNTKVRA